MGTRKDERTLQRLELSADNWKRLETLYWVLTEAHRITEAGNPALTKEQINDGVVAQFLTSLDEKAERLYRPGVRGATVRTMWLKTPYVNKCRQLAERDGVPSRLVIRYIFEEVLQKVVDPAWVELRDKIGKEVSQKLGHFLRILSRESKDLASSEEATPSRRAPRKRTRT